MKGPLCARRVAALGSIRDGEMLNGRPLECGSCFEGCARSGPLDIQFAHPPESTVLVLVRSLTACG